MNESSEHAGSALVKIGNADLVRGISDCLSVHRAIGDQKPTQAIYEELIAALAEARAGVEPEIARRSRSAPAKGSGSGAQEACCARYELV